MGGKRRLILEDGLLYCFVLFFVLSMAGMAYPVFAQEDEDVDVEELEFMLEDIIVTAEKREAEIQKIPMDITVVRPDDMVRMNVHQMTELQKMIPDLETEDVAGNGAVQLRIRGVEIPYWNVTAEATVAVSIDGVQLPRANALEGKFYDLERVEMLKGPQGTLYGRGSTAGSLSMVSKRPDIGAFGGNIQVEYGSYDRRRIEGAFNIPATDKLAFRLSGRSVKRGSYDDINVSTQDMWGVRGSMRWEPTDRQSLVVTVDTDSTNNKGGQNFQGVYFETFGDLEIVANDDPTLSDAFREKASGGTVSTPYEAAWYFDGDVSDATTRTDSHGLSINYNHEFDLAWWTFRAGHRSSESKTIWYWTSTPTLRPEGSTLNLTWQPTDTMDSETGEIYPSGSGPQEEGKGYARWFSYSTAIIPRYTDDGIDEWGRPYEEGDIIPTTEMILVPGSWPNVVGSRTFTTARSSELESYFTSKESIAGGDKTEWIVGGLWMDDMVINDTYVAENAYNDITLREYALYGQGSYAPFARLSFSAGYRRVWDTKYYTGYKFDNPYIESGPDNWAYFMGAVFVKDPEMFNHYAYKVDYGTYKFNISWQATDNILPYIQYSKGMKTLNVDRSTGSAIPPEQLNSVDAGVKTRLFDGRLQLNLSGYYYDYRNYNTWATSYQCRVKSYDDDGNFRDCKILGDSRNRDVDYINYVYGIISAGGAKQHGGSANIIWMITPSDRFSLNASYQHNEYNNWNMAEAMKEMFEPIWGVGNVDSAELPANQTDKTGDRFGGRPYRGNFTYSHIWFIGTDMLNVTLTGLYEGEGLKQIVAENTDNEHYYPGYPDYITFDLSVDYSSTRWMPEGCRWSVRLYGNNILDSDELSNRRYVDDYNQFGANWRFAPNSGYITGSFITPRTLGVQFTVNF